MLPSKFRLPLKFTLNDLKKTGQNHSGLHLTIVTRPNRLSHPRVGIIVSTKISKLATKRNLLRRRLVESVKPWMKKHNKNIDLLLLPKKTALNQTVPFLTREIDRLLS